MENELAMTPFAADLRSHWLRCLCLLLLLCQPCIIFAQPGLDGEFLTREATRLDALFAALDLNRPGLEPVREAVEQGDREEAALALLAYYRERPAPVLGSVLANLEVASPEAALPLAEDALRDTFTIQGVTARQPRTRQGGLDWRHHGPRNDKEWAWLLNRHRHFRELLVAYATTGRAEFVLVIDEQLRDWIRQNRYPGRLTFSEPWRALEVARRMLDAWPQVFEELRQSPHWSAESRLLFLSSIPDHADALRHYASFWGGNHLVTEKTALAKLAIVWPEFRESPEWLAYAQERVELEFLRQSYPDGSYKELTNHYQRVVAWNAQRFLELLENNGHAAAPALRERVEAMWDYFAFVMRPNGTGPLNNAADLEYNRGVIAHLHPYFARSDWQYLIFHGREGERPDGLPSRFFPWAGQAIARGDWNADSLWAFFDLGPHGTAHQHQDRLHVSLSVGQQDFLEDSGRYTYRPGAWHDYFAGPAGHNVLLVNGEPSLIPPREARGEPLPAVVQIEPDFDFFAGSVRFPDNPRTGIAGARQTRALLHVRNRYWIIADSVTLFGPHTITAYWNHHPDCQVTVASDGWVARTASGRHLRVLIPPDPHGSAGRARSADWETNLHRGETTPRPLGWYSHNFNLREPATTAVLTRTLTRPTRILWVFLPFQEEAAPPEPEITRQTHPDGSETITLLWPDQTSDRITFSDSGVRELDIGIIAD